MNDYETFQKQLPHTLIPTNIPGAFTTPAPPDDFDPNTASHTSLIKNGFFWNCPQEGDDPRLITAWENAFSRRWLAKDRIIPHLEPQIGKIHFPRHLQKTDTKFITDNNWSGCVLSDAGQWSGVIAQWAVPTVSKPTEPPGQEGGWSSASWIGIDGQFSNDVLQAGVEQKVDKNGNATYTAWYEWFCSFEKLTLNQISDVSPALASLNGNLYIAWKGEDGRGFLNVMATADGGQTFGTKFISSDITSQAPVLTVHNNLLRIGWTGIDGKGRLNVATTDTEGLTIIGYAPPPLYVYQTNIPNFTVNPGDIIQCSVQYIAGKTAGQISFANNTTSQNFSITLAPPPGAALSGNCIEWIMEAPDGGLPTSALPSFIPVVFTSAIGCSPARKTLGDPQNGDIINIVNGPQPLTAVTLGSDTVTIDFIG